MSAWRPMRAALVVIALTLLPVAACSDTGTCEMGPVTPVVRSGLFLPTPPAPPNANAACPWWVEFDGRRYSDTRAGWSFIAWSITDEDVRPIGRATSRLVWMPAFPDDTVFQVGNVDPSRAVAMRTQNGQMTVLLVGGFPTALCPYLPGAPPDTSIQCPRPSSEPPPPVPASSPCAPNCRRTEGSG